MSIYGYILGNAKQRRDQRRRISSYCKAFGLELSEVFYDSSESCVPFNQRKGASKTIAASQPGDTVLVTSIDVVMNTLEDASFGIEIVKLRQIDVIVIDLNISIFSSILFIKTIELLKEKYIKHSLGKLSGTVYSGGSTPYGYHIVGGVLHAVEDEHKVIGTIIDLRNQGKSLRSISEALCEQETVLSHKAIERIIHRESDLI